MLQATEAGVNVRPLESAGRTGGVTHVETRALEAFRWMLLARLLDDKFGALYRAGKIHGGVFLSRGQEALSAAIGMALRQGDVFAPLIRDTAGRLAFGEPLLDSVRTYLGSSLGPTAGRDGNVHRGRPREGLLPMISHLGAMIAVVNGVLMARRMQGRTGVVGATCVGDGATSTGAFHEALNQAAIERLPLVLVVANNQFAYSTPTSRQFACSGLELRAAGYGVEAAVVDGTDLLACLGTFETVVTRARAGHGPQLVVADLLRLCGHGEHDDASYIGQELRQSRRGQDCLRLAEEELSRRGWVTAEQVRGWREAFVKRIEETVAQVQREPVPDPYREAWCALATPHLAEGGHAPIRSGSPSA